MIRRLTTMGRLAPLAWSQPRFPFRDLADIERVRDRRIAGITEHAYREVPHYREEIERLGLAPEDIRTPADLARLPLLSREQVQREGERLTSRNLGEKGISFSSSGSTGTPITTVWDPPGVLAHLGYGERSRAVKTSIIGRRWGYRESSCALLGGTGTKVYETRTNAAWLPRFLIDRHYIQMREGPAANISDLLAFDPHLLRSYGSYLDSLFLEFERQGVRPPSLKLAEFSGDAIGEEARGRIEERFGIPVVGVYNAHETLDIAFECEQRSGYHVNIDLCPIRIVDEAGRDLPDGEVGEVIVSNLVNRGTVLLNYRIGDLGAMRPGRCRCGRNLPLLDLAEGRESTWIGMDGGRRVHGMEIRIPLKDDPGVRHFRIIQVAADRVEVAVVAQPSADRDTIRTRLVGNLRAVLGPEGTIDIDFTDHISPGPAGKHQAVISLIE